MNPTLQLTFAALATLAFVGLDARDAEYRAGWWRDSVRRTRNLSYLVSNVVTMAALASVNGIIECSVPRLLDWRGPGVVVETIACVVVAEAINWISHALKHMHPWLWRFHLQHHVSRHYDTTLTLHTHGLEVVVSGAIMACVLVACGFSRVAVDVFTLLYYVTNLYKHQRAPLSLGWLDVVIVSPAYHRLHHAVGHTGNYGSVLTLFDVVCGTARWPDARAFELPSGTDGGEPFGFVNEMAAPFASATRSAHARKEAGPP